MQDEQKDPIDEIRVELDDQNATAPAKRPLYDQKQRSTKRLVLIIVAVVAGLALAGGALYWFALRDTGAEQQGADPAEETAQQQEGPRLDPAEAAQLVTFHSEELDLEFEHRRDWTVTESADGAEIILSSPPVSYQTITGQVPEGNGVFTLKIRRGVTDAMRDTINNANAIRASELIGYAEPTEAQRHFTNISFAGPEDAFSFLIVTGSAEYESGDPLAGTLPLSGDFYLIAGGFGDDIDNALAFDAVPASQIDSQAMQQATAIIESLKLF